jgi:enoyl-CoA hydratase/carnithine racemase
MAKNDIRVKQDGPVLRITLNQPKRGNAVSDDMVRELTRLIRGAPKKSDIIVLRGAGSDFCVGRAGMGARPAVEPTAYARRKFSDVVFDAYGVMRNCPIPIVCVVQGGAHGFGCAIAAACDITIASDKARFSVPEMAHQIMPTMVLSSFVDRVPRKAMAYMLYSMFEVSAERALSYGIVSDVVPAAKLDATVDKLIAAMLKAPKISLTGAKEYIRAAPDMPTAGAVEYARNLHATINSAAEIHQPRGKK